MFKLKTTYEIRSIDWSADVFSSDLASLHTSTCPQLLPLRCSARSGGSCACARPNQSRELRTRELRTPMNQHAAIIVLLFVVACSGSIERLLPADAQAFVEQRDLCDHFRGEAPYDEQRQPFLEQNKLGRASCRERVFQYVLNSVVGGSLKK